MKSIENLYFQYYAFFIKIDLIINTGIRAMASEVTEIWAMN